MFAIGRVDRLYLSVRTVSFGTMAKAAVYDTIRMKCKDRNFFSRFFSDQRNFERPFLPILDLGPGWHICLVGDKLPGFGQSVKGGHFHGLDDRPYFPPLVLALGFRPPSLAGSVSVYSRVCWLFSPGIDGTALPGLCFGLYPGLIGLVIGLPVKRRWRILAIGFIPGFIAGQLSHRGRPRSSCSRGRWRPSRWWSLSPYTYPMYLRQAEARKQAQVLLRDLEAANRQLTEYAARVEDLTIANERQRMARELHDTLSQGLAGLDPAARSGGCPPGRRVVLNGRRPSSSGIDGDGRAPPGGRPACHR